MPIGSVEFIAVAGVVLATLLITLAHRRRPELRASEIPLSAYFSEPTRATMTVAYAAIAVALFATAFVQAAASTAEMRIAAIVTGLACCIAAVLLLPVAVTTQRNPTIVRSEAVKRAHRYSAIAVFAAAGVAMAVSAGAAIVQANAFVAVCGLVGAVLVANVLRSKPGPVYGLWQRLVLAALGLWILAIATSG